MEGSLLGRHANICMLGKLRGVLVFIVDVDMF